MNNFNNNTDNKDEWLTPPEIISSLGVFSLDPCSPDELMRPWPTAYVHYSKKDDGLSREWFGRVWCNPPYGRDTFKWLNKLAAHGNGTALIFARTETKGFHSEVWGKADAVLFLKGRINFYHVSGERGGRPNAPSCLVAYGAADVELLKNSGIKGAFVDLRGNTLRIK